MEAAAKTVELLTQRHLPEKPHNLSASPDWRHTKPTTESRPFEEWNSQRLQYSTFLSEADRGVLLTRPYYDMREEPPKPVPREVNALSSKNSSEKKKLSLSDYKNKKTTGAAPSPEPSTHRGREDSNHSTPSHNTPSGSSAPPRSHADSKPSQESRPMEHSRSRESDSSGDSRRHPNSHRPDTSLPPKPLPKNSSLPPRPPSPLNKRRVPGYDDDARPQKKNRAEDDRGYDDRGRNRDDYHNRRDNGRRDTSLPNGKGLPRSSSYRSASPNPRSRGDPVNGVRSHASAGSNRGGTPTKQLTPSKGSVPPLLSPLRLGFEEEERNSKRRRDESPERSPRPRKSETSHDAKKPKMKLPPLLSPTLPPVVEAALQRKRKEADDDNDAEPPRAQVDASDDDLPPRPKKERKRFMVTLKVKKAYRADFRRLLALSSQGRKRPASNADSGTEGVAMKKSRSSDMHQSSSRSLGPSTPPRKSGTTAMSRVNSNNSTAQTPGDPAPQHPPSDRRTTNGQEMPKAASALKERESRMSQLGRRLKHDADVAFRGQQTPNSGRSNEPDSKLGYVLGLESILAFMLGFQALNQYRTACNKSCDPSGWKSLFPYMDYLNREIRRNEHNRPKYLPLSALLQLFNAMAVEESLKCCLTLEGTPNVSLADVLKLERMRSRIWPQVREETAGIDDPRYKTEVHPWTTLDEVAAAAVRVLRRWSADEDLDWSPEVNSRDYGR